MIENEPSTGIGIPQKHKRAINLCQNGSVQLSEKLKLKWYKVVHFVPKADTVGIRAFWEKWFGNIKKFKFGLSFDPDIPRFQKFIV